MHKPKVFVVGEDGQTLLTLEETGYVNEKTLHLLLARYPDLLPGDQIDPENPRRWLLVALEMGVPGNVAEIGRWSLDLLFLDQDGIPTFVECKRATDTRIRREVVAQMLDYAANGVEYWTMDRLRQVAAETARARDRSLDDEVASLLGASPEPVDLEGFWSQVEANLQNRRIRLIFVADTTPKELRRLVEFLNEEMTSVEVLAVEIKLYQRPDETRLQALVPRVIGLTETARMTKSSTSGRRQWTEQQFFAALSTKVAPEIFEIIRELYDWSSAVAHRVWFGTGIETGSFTFHYLKDGITFSVFSVYTSGTLILNYGWLSQAVDEKIMRQFHEFITRIGSFSQIPADFSRWPSVKISQAFANTEHLDEFKQAVKWLGEHLELPQSDRLAG